MLFYASAYKLHKNNNTEIQYASSEHPVLSAAISIKKKPGMYTLCSGLYVNSLVDFFLSRKGHHSLLLVNKPSPCRWSHSFNFSNRHEIIPLGSWWHLMTFVCVCGGVYSMWVLRSASWTANGSHLQNGFVQLQLAHRLQVFLYWVDIAVVSDAHIISWLSNYRIPFEHNVEVAMI